MKTEKEIRKRLDIINKTKNYKGDIYRQIRAYAKAEVLEWVLDDKE